MIDWLINSDYKYEYLNLQKLVWPEEAAYIWWTWFKYNITTLHTIFLIKHFVFHNFKEIIKVEKSISSWFSCIFIWALVHLISPTHNIIVIANIIWLYFAGYYSVRLSITAFVISIVIIWKVNIGLLITLINIWLLNVI